MPPAKHKPYAEQGFDHLTGLDGISDDQIGEHRALYAGYVRQVNTLNAELSTLRERGRASGRDAEFAELTRRLGFEYNGMILHEHYFSNLASGAPPKPEPASRLARALAESFGSVEAWRADFPATGGMRAAGLVLLCEAPMTRRLTNHAASLVLGGLRAALVRSREGRRLILLRGPWPRCGAAEEFRPGGRFASGRSFDCPKCHGNVTLAVPPSG